MQASDSVNSETDLHGSIGSMLQAISCNETIALEPHCLVTFFLGGKFTKQLFGFQLWIAGSCRIVFTRYPAHTL